MYTSRPHGDGTRSKLSGRTKFELLVQVFGQAEAISTASRLHGNQTE
jgi:hypothetical protein